MKPTNLRIYREVRRSNSFLLILTILAFSAIRPRAPFGSEPQGRRHGRGVISAVKSIVAVTLQSTYFTLIVG